VSELDKIGGFVRRHHVMTVATVGAGNRADGADGESAGGANSGAWVAHVFYAWLAGEGLFVFTTDTATRHGAEMAANSRVAAGVALETRTVGRVQGLQVEGRVRRAEGAELKSARAAYLRRFPYAVVAPLSLWLLEPTLMKLTDNTLGFGKKLIWHKA
jgi:uncharacterized protein YhbP (UPF0306 family)